jgi:tetratricopeptide (TPR) repeat protein
VKFPPAIAILAVTCAPPGCTTPNTTSAGNEYYAGRPDSAEHLLLAARDKDENARALYEDELGVIALDRRDLDAAYQHFLEANRIMEAFATTDAKELGAVLGTEASKIWRGDPYEKSMNNYYLGIVKLLRGGEDDNALAGFKNAIFLDSSREEQFDCDFAPAYFLEALCYELLGDSEMASRSYARARELAPECTAAAESNHGNLVVVVDVGRGPTKVNAGQHGEATRFVDHPEIPAAIDVLVDGEKIGAAQTAGDVYFQASTRGGRAFDYVLRGKAAYKTGAQMAGIGTLLVADDLADKYQTAAVITGIALLLSSFTVDARADTRHWTTLPARVQLLRASLAPGRHEIEIVPSSGWRVAGPRVQEVTIDAHGDRVVYQRVLP